MTDAAGRRFRQAVRALLITPDHEVLLVRFEFPDATVWAPPGGGLEPGEDHLAALTRELREEVGLLDTPIGPHLWNREMLVSFELGGRWDGQQDRVYLVPTPRFEPQPALSWDELRAERIHELRWWPLDEIEAAVDTWFVPRRLPELLSRLVSGGPPATPIDTVDPPALPR